MDVDDRVRDIFGKPIKAEGAGSSVVSCNSLRKQSKEDDEWGSMSTTATSNEFGPMIRTVSTKESACLYNPESSFNRSRNSDGGGRGRRGQDRMNNSRQGGDRFDRNSRRGGGGRRRGGQFDMRNPNRDERFDRKPLNFERVCDYLSLTTDGVIMGLGKEVEEWGKFLESDELVKNKNSLMVTMQLLGIKVCCESILTSEQVSILTKTSAINFIAAIVTECGRILESFATDSAEEVTQTLCIFSRSGFIQLERSPIAFLANVYKYSKYMVHRMVDEFPVISLLPVISSAGETILTMKEKEETKELRQKLGNLLKNFEELKLEVQSLVTRQDGKKSTKEVNSNGLADKEGTFTKEEDAPDDFRFMTIVPSLRELLSEEEVFLRRNKTSGAYDSAHHYLDVQFRLLRQDFVQPLKLGIQDFLKYREEYTTNRKKLPCGSIRVYTNVTIKGMVLERAVLVYKLQLNRGSYEKINWATSKRLLTGSLMVLSSDLFKTAYFAVVADRDVQEMSEGILTVSWEGRRPKLDTHCEYLMIECEVYFEAFRHTLQILQVLELQDFPMCKFIVSASSDVDTPQYLKDIEGTRRIKLKDGTFKTFNTLEVSEWPTDSDLGLDANQFQAFQAAMTKEFAIIQGPPGTGKTYLGLRIVEALLDTQHSRGKTPMGPILVVCYTNHALDQFLEGILELNNETPIIRVGGRCKSEKLEKYTLTYVSRLQSAGLLSKDYWSSRRNLRAKIDELQSECAEVLTTVTELQNLQGIVDFISLSIWTSLVEEYPRALWDCLCKKDWYGLTDSMFESLDFEEEMDSIISTMFQIQQGTDVQNLRANDNDASKSRVNINFRQNHRMEDGEVDGLLENRIFDDILPDFEKLSLQKYFKLSYVDSLSIDDCENFLDTSNSILAQIRSQDIHPLKRKQNLLDAQKHFRVAKNRKMLLERIFSLYKANRIVFPEVKELLEKSRILSNDRAKAEFQNIDLGQRWALYFEVVEQAQTVYSNKIPRIEVQLAHEQKKLEQVYLYAKGVLLQNVQVVGMTTTGAAKYRELVKMMQSKIVIVEEAAEVLESHIVTCITPRCEHLILIGDHRQLRPSTVVYELARKFNLDVSLFERMINNDLNCYPLKLQHRMRPEIANLVVGTIYKELENHPSVSEYPTVPGVTKNLFFLSHNKFEDSEMDSMSKSNQFEAKYLAGLCKYLILQGYSPDQITVLTTYTGQMFLLKKTVQQYPECDKVRITSVDSFQGEENDIILLSLVRSNQETSLGFMSIDNRICVALSRARHGLFIVGNMAMLSSKSDVWFGVLEKLTVRGEIGPSLRLKCETHGTEYEIRNEDDFAQKVPSGGCQLRCDTVLQCNHKCEQFCHVTDICHENLFKCRMPCIKRCRNNHPCKGLCSDSPCPPCSALINKTLKCSHDKLMRCCEYIEDVECNAEVPKKLLCGHTQTVPCHLDPRGFRCGVKVEKELLCGHRRDMKCSEDPVLVDCKELVMKKLTPCGHEQKVECKFGPSVVRKCEALVTKVLNCGHMIETRCGDSNNTLQCKRGCKTA